MLDEGIEIVVQTLRVVGGADQLPHRVDDDPTDLRALDLPKEADDDPVDLEFDRRRVHQLEPAPLDVLDVGPQGPQRASELHRVLLEVGVEARLPTSHAFEDELKTGRRLARPRGAGHQGGAPAPEAPSEEGVE